jgi:hypothetical protein
MYSRMSAMGQPANAVAQVQHTRPVQGTEQFELDVVGRHALEQPTALPEQHGHQLQLHLVQQAGTKALLRGRGAVQQDVAATPRVWPLCGPPPAALIESSPGLPRRRGVPVQLLDLGQVTHGPGEFELVRGHVHLVCVHTASIPSVTLCHQRLQLRRVLEVSRHALRGNEFDGLVRM